VRVLFLDESGDHNLTVVDLQYPLFVLGGVIVEKEYAEGELGERLAAFKQRLFGRTDLVLHTSDLVRNRNGFELMKEPAFRHRFYTELNRLMRELRYTVVACAIRKDMHLSRYGLAALDPYLLSLDILVERFCFEIGKEGSGVIVAERRGPELDRQLELAWLNLKIQGTRYVQAKEVERRIVGLNLRGKADNLAGLQLADLVVSPIGRHVLGKPEQEDFRIVREKLRCNSRGEYRGYGLVVLPK
jgi:hypothetical protein